MLALPASAHYREYNKDLIFLAFQTEISVILNIFYHHFSKFQNLV